MARKIFRKKTFTKQYSKYNKRAPDASVIKL